MHCCFVPDSALMLGPRNRRVTDPKMSTKTTPSFIESLKDKKKIFSLSGMILYLKNISI